MVELKSEKVELITKDNVKIKATYFEPSKIKRDENNNDIRKGLVLLHQFSKNKESWLEWIPFFEELEIEILALDLRGHGESQLNYKNFKDKDFNDMLSDLKSGRDFLLKKGLKEENISYIGASIGANTVQNFISENEFDKAVLLSPGLNYKGINLKIKDNQALMVVSVEDEYSYNTVKTLEKKSPFSEFLYLEDKGHGTNMLDQEIIQRIIEFLKK